MRSLAIPQGRLSLMAVSGVGFIVYAAASIHDKIAGAWLVCLVSAFALGYLCVSIRWLWLAFIAFCLVNVLGQLIAWAGLSGYLYAGLDLSWGAYGNPNYLGCALALGLAASVTYRLWVVVPPVALGLWLTQSRTALLAASTVLFIALWGRSRFWAFILALGGIAAVALSSHGEANGVWQRLGIWQDTLNHLTMWGQGWGSFSDAYTSWPVHRNMTLLRTDHAYNDFLEAIFELGLGAVLLWAFLISVLSQSQSPTKLIIYCWAVMALTYFPLSVLPVGPLLAATLGNLVRDSNGT